MKVTYDSKPDTVVLLLRDGAEVAASDDVTPGLVDDHDTDGTVVTLEFVDASRRLTRADKAELQPGRGVPMWTRRT